MEIQRIEKILASNSYPGRGIVLGRSMDGKSAVIAYFIMGRSENSRNRVFVKDGDGIRTQAYDFSKLEDPSLIIYSPVRVLNGRTIVTNGDQTDTIYDHLHSGKTFFSALQTRTFEPDEPNFTPRISGIVEPDGRYQLSILKSAYGNPASVLRFYFTYDAPLRGVGHLIHTYQADGCPLPSFEGEPRPIRIPENINDFTNEIWNALDKNNRISLFTRFIDLDTGETDTRMMNQYQ